MIQEYLKKEPQSRKMADSNKQLESYGPKLVENQMGSPVENTDPLEPSIGGSKKKLIFTTLLFVCI